VTDNRIALNNGVQIIHTRFTKPSSESVNYWGFNPGNELRFLYDYPNTGTGGTNVTPLYFHVTGSTVHQYVDKTHPECIFSRIDFSGLSGFGDITWEVRAQALVEDVMPIDQYVWAGWMSAYFKGFNVKHNLRMYGIGIAEWVWIKNYYKIEVLPTYVMNISDLCLYNICAPTWVP